MYNASSKDNSASKLGYKAIKLCLNESLPDSRVLGVMNKMPTLSSLRRTEGANAEEKLWEVFRENRAAVSNYLQMEHEVSNVVMISNEQHGEDFKAEEIHQRVAHFPETPMDCSRFKTFSEVLMQARALRDGTVDRVAFANGKIMDLESARNNLIEDIDWHENRATAMKASIAAAGVAGGVATLALGFFTFGIASFATGAATAAAIAGMTAALADSVAKIPLMREKVAQIDKDVQEIRENVEGKLEQEKQKYTAFLAEVEEAETVLALE